MNSLILLSIAITIISIGVVLYNLIHYYKLMNKIRDHKSKITIENKSGKKYKIDLGNIKDSKDLMTTVDHILH